MRAWAVETPAPIDRRPLRLLDRPVPTPGRGEVRVEVSACGVCRTDLHVVEGDLSRRRASVVPGHEVVGIVAELGPDCSRLEVGDRVGVPWLAHTCGRCQFCLTERENLCVAPTFTGWDVDGGYAEHVVADERYVYRLPDHFCDQEVAPLLCAGIIGFRALRRSGVKPGQRLGIYGFGGSAHITAQVAIAEGVRVHVLTRSEPARRLALDLGAASAGAADDQPPEPLDAAILFAPIGELVLPALEGLERGGTLAIAGIHLSDIPKLNYARHLFEERTLCSVTANTRKDGEEFFEIAARIPVHVTTTAYPLEAADRALSDLAHDRLTGAAVLMIGAPEGR